MGQGQDVSSTGQEVSLTCDGSLRFQDTLLFLAIDFKPTEPIFLAGQLV